MRGAEDIEIETENSSDFVSDTTLGRFFICYRIVEREKCVLAVFRCKREVCTYDVFCVRIHFYTPA